LVVSTGHSALLYFARALFPFKTVLAIVPLGIIEGTVLAILMLKILGN
jgi:hypothetical protein